MTHENKEPHIISYNVTANKTYSLDLHQWGPRSWWPTDAIWSVAHREMWRLFGVGCSCWTIETPTKPKTRTYSAD